MDVNTIRERVGAMCIASALMLKTSLGDEAPGVLEMLDLELPRILAIPALFKHVPAYKNIDPDIARDISADPWNRVLNLDVLLDAWARNIESNDEIDATSVVSIVEEYAFASDFTVYSVIRRGQPPIEDPDVIMAFIDDACGILSIDLDMVYMMVIDVYRTFFTQLQ